MKYLIIYTAVIILFIPPLIMGCIAWLWKPKKQSFHDAGNWLHDKFGYGNWVDNLMDEVKN